MWTLREWMDNRSYVWFCTFFRVRLLYATPDEIPTILRSYKKQSEAIIKEISDIVIYLNGSITWEEAWNLSFKEKEILIERLKKYHENKNK